MAEMTLLIHPSLEESFGMTVVEAMALALPVVGGIKSGAIPWLLGAGEHGMLVDVKDSKQIANVVLELLNNPVAYSAMALASQAYARKHFLITDVAEKYETLYKQAVSQKLQLKANQ